MVNLIPTLKRFNCLFFVLLLAALSGCKGGFGGSTDAGLARLSISPGNMEPSFARETYEYDVTLAMSEDSIIFNARVSDDDATMQLRRLTSQGGASEETFDLSDDTDSSSISVDVGSNYFEVVVTSANESTKTYEIVVTRQSTESSNADLAGLEAVGVNLGFDKDEQTEVYASDVNYFINSTRLKATLDDPGAQFESFSGKGNLQSGSYSERLELAVGENTAYDIVVEASDRATTKNYSVSLTRKEKNDIDYSAFLKASNASNGDQFGSSVAVSHNTIAVGAPTKSDEQGAAYFYRPTSDTWGQVAAFTGENTGDQFGVSIAIYDSTILVGAPGEQNNRGKVYVYRENNGNWSLQDTLQANGTVADDDRFGSALAISGTQLAVAAEGAGRVYLFDVESLDFSQTLGGAEGSASETFGASLAFNSDNELVIGAPNAAGNSQEVNAGVVYLYKRSSNSFTLSRTIRPSEEAAEALFGTDVDAKSNTLAVGAPGMQTQGRTVIFKRANTGSRYEQDAVIAPENSDSQEMRFGYSLALFNESMLAVGAPDENKQDFGKDPSAQGVEAASVGAVFVFGNNLQASTSNTYEWEQEMYLKAEQNASGGDSLGEAIAAYNNRLVFGAKNEDTGTGVVNASPNDNGEDVGAVFVVE
ncbi:hypothetical protein TDB9533_04367 [Thalassocella blandensis]|nr:hypothetical protein TDB9533_04367 [Thalassocella blandensis]